MFGSIARKIRSVLLPSLLLAACAASPAAAYRVCIQKGNGIYMWIDYGTRQIWIETDLVGGG